MCRIDYCDDPYWHVPVPAAADRSRCTDCLRPLEAGEAAEVVAGVGPDQFPDVVARRRDGTWLIDWSEGDPLDDIEWAPRPDEPLPPGECHVTPHDWADEFDAPPDIPYPAANVHVTCGQCLEARDWIIATCGGWVYDCVREEIVEHWDENEVDHSLALGRLVVWARRAKWTDRRTGRMISPAKVAGLVSAALGAA